MIKWNIIIERKVIGKYTNDERDRKRDMDKHRQSNRKQMTLIASICYFPLIVFQLFARAWLTET